MPILVRPYYPIIIVPLLALLDYSKQRKGFENVWDLSSSAPLMHAPSGSKIAVPVEKWAARPTHLPASRACILC